MMQKRGGGGRRKRAEVGSRYSKVKCGVSVVELGSDAPLPTTHSPTLHRSPAHLLTLFRHLFPTLPLFLLITLAFALEMTRQTYSLYALSLRHAFSAKSRRKITVVTQSVSTVFSLVLSLLSCRLAL
jgi:hypothetical protein